MSARLDFMVEVIELDRTIYHQGSSTSWQKSENISSGLRWVMSTTLEQNGLI